MRKTCKVFSTLIMTIIFLNFTFTSKALGDDLLNNKYLAFKNILILNSCTNSSYDKSLSYGLNLYLQELLPNSNQVYENLKTSQSESCLDRLNFILNNSSKYDLIICLDKASANLINSVDNNIINDVPTLFAYADDVSPNVSNNMAGYFIPYDFSGFLKQILTLHPNTRDVNIIINKGFELTYFYEKIQSTIKEYKDSNLRINFNYIVTSFDKSNLKSVDNKQSLNILFAESFKQVSGELFKEYTGYGTERYLATLTSKPIYGGFSEHISAFNIGTYNYSGLEIGRMLAYDSIDILSGKKSIADIGIKEYSIDNKLLLNSDLTSEYNIPNGLENTEYKSFALDEIDMEKNQNIFFIFLITILFVLILSLIGLNFYVKKLYLERLRIDKMKNNFIANVSHELRTPLNIIISCIQLLEIQKNKGDITSRTPDFDQKFLYLQKNSSRLLRLVNNIIDITKIDAGFFRVDKSENDIISVVEDITLSSVPYAESKNISLIFDTDVEELFFSFDKERIERVVLNLLSNSLKFTPDDGEILVTIEKKDKFVIIKVKDSGIGIESDKQVKIFDRFVQAEDSLYRKSEGSGIGLSICKALVELHNGKIYIESEIDKGSTFIIELPIILNSSKYSNKIAESIEKQVNIEYSDFSNYI